VRRKGKKNNVEKKNKIGKMVIMERKQKMMKNKGH
jgi:hypothetical protein